MLQAVDRADLRGVHGALQLLSLSSPSFLSRSSLLGGRFRFRCKFFTPERGIKRGSGRTASFNIGNSCSITLFHRRFTPPPPPMARFCVYQRVPSPLVVDFTSLNAES